jgi:hypothetical protein
MADGRHSKASEHVARCVARGRYRADSATYLNERLVEELRRVGEELVDEPVPKRLRDVIRAWQDNHDG